MLDRVVVVPFLLLRASTSSGGPGTEQSGFVSSRSVGKG